MAKNKRKTKGQARKRAQARAQDRALAQLVELRNDLRSYVYQPTRWTLLKEFYAEQIGVLDNAIETVRRDGAPDNFEDQFAAYCSEMAEVERDLS